MKRLRALYFDVRARWAPAERYAIEVGDALFAIQLQLWRIAAATTREIANELERWADKEQIP